MSMKITADYEKIRSLSNALFGASPIQLPYSKAKRLAEKHAQQVLAAYRADCHAALIKGGLIKATK